LKSRLFSLSKLRHIQNLPTLGVFSFRISKMKSGNVSMTFAIVLWNDCHHLDAVLKLPRAILRTVWFLGFEVLTAVVMKSTIFKGGGGR
jgi:hypothetical protein